MANSRRLLGLALLCGLLSRPATSQESLLDVYRRAIQNDPAIREAEATYLADAEVKPQARASLLPTLSLGSSRQHFFQANTQGFTDPVTGEQLPVPTEIDRDTDSWNVSLNQTVFDWGLYATLRQADKRVAQAETNYEAAKQNLMIRVANVYFDVLAAEDTLGATAVTREARARQLEQAQRRFEVGLIAITDVQEFQAGYDTAVADEIAAQRVLATAREFLREVIDDIPPDLAGPGDDLPLLTPDPASADAWAQTANAQNLALIASRIAADISQDAIDIQRAERLPSLSLSASYSEQTQDQTFTRFNPPPLATVTAPSLQSPVGRNWQLSLQFPIFTGGLNRSRIQQSVYQHRASLEALEQVARATERQARDAYLGVVSEISRVRALQQAVESSRTALRATEAGFEVGTRTTVDVLTSQDNLRTTETTFASSRYQYILNLLLLKQAAGTLSEADVEQVDGWLE
jgi:outer membrane protein